jgi:hypothetical protein
VTLSSGAAATLTPTPSLISSLGLPSEPLPCRCSPNDRCHRVPHSVRCLGHESQQPNPLVVTVEALSTKPPTAPKTWYSKGMKNTHLEHAEDSILTGDLSVLDWFVNPGHLSVKIDGAPAIVWGLQSCNWKLSSWAPKAVFNKKLRIKISRIS